MYSVGSCSTDECLPKMLILTHTHTHTHTVFLISMISKGKLGHCMDQSNRSVPSSGFETFVCLVPYLKFNLTMP